MLVQVVVKRSIGNLDSAVQRANTLQLRPPLLTNWSIPIPIRANPSLIMPKHAKKSARKSSSRKGRTKTIVTRTVGVRPVAARQKIRNVDLLETEVVQPHVDAIETTTEVETVPTIEIRRPATLSQALTEPTTIVEKPKTRVIGRTVKRKRVA